MYPQSKSRSPSAWSKRGRALRTGRHAGATESGTLMDTDEHIYYFLHIQILHIFRMGLDKTFAGADFIAH